MPGQTTRPPTSVSFTFEWYREFLQFLEDMGYHFRRFSDGAEAGGVLLRHDIDLSIQKALATARIEAERGINATYCILLTTPLYNPLEGRRVQQIRAIEALGHEVALHFSTHEYWDQDTVPDEETFVEHVAAEQAVLGTLLTSDPETVSFHMPPSWILDRSFESFRNTYEPPFFSDIQYVADSGQRWRREPPEIPEPRETVQILTHPGLWGEEDQDFRACIEESISETSSHMEEKAHREFLAGGERQ